MLPPSPQDDSLQDYEEEVARVLENMGIFGEGREQSRSFEGKNYAHNQFAPTGSLCHDETIPFTGNLEEKRELVPSMEKPLEA